MRTLKKFGVLAVAVFALSVVGVASASAAEFTASATGSIEGHALENQVFTTNGGTVTCSTAKTKGAIVKTASAEQEANVNYSGCTAFTFATVDISEAKYIFNASGTAQITKAITITPTLLGSSLCTVTVGTQTVSTTGFANAGTSNVKVSPNVTGISYTSTGGSCGASGTNGTYKGANEVNREGGGTLRFDP
jgi:hypothetical protein